MTNELFRNGGGLRAKRVGHDEYEMSITLPTDEDGRIARECHAEGCSPAYFKVKLGTGLSGAETAFCPYCRHEEEPQGFFTSEQLRYAKDRVLSEASDGVTRMLKDAIGLGPSGKRTIGGGLFSIEMSLKEGSKPHVWRPFEEEVRRDVVCPHCELDQSVYGLATWCADCGMDIFLTHVEAELAVVRLMLADIGRRRESLGKRVAAKDTENCLEDTVSIFEAVLKAMVRRHLIAIGTDQEAVEKAFKQIGNAFQNMERAADVLTEKVNVRLPDILTAAELHRLGSIFGKRHPITHNLGVIDRKYLERVQSAEQEGKEVLVTVSEVEESIDLSLTIFRSMHAALFEGTATP